METSRIGRLPISNVQPVVDGGVFAAKAFEGEVIPFSATVFREGHDSLGAELLLTSPAGKTEVIRMHAGAPGSDRWHAKAQVKELGTYTFQIRAFGDDYDTWHHSAAIKVAAGMDEELMMLEGIALFTRAASEKGRTPANAKALVELAEKLSDKKRSAKARLAEAEAPAILKLIAPALALGTSSSLAPRVRSSTPRPKSGLRAASRLQPSV